MEETISAFVSDNVKRGGLGDKLNAIERAAGGMDDLVLTCINSACQQNVAPLGQDAVCAFLDAMYLVSIRARMAYPEGPAGKNLGQRTKAICESAGKFGAIAANVSNGRVFCLVCSGMERIRDLRVLSKYINYMHSISKQIRSESNPDGRIKDAGTIAFQARFIAERSDGTNAEYVDRIITRLIMKLNEIVSETP